MRAEDRKAVLDALYRERRALTRKARSGDLDAFDKQSLDDVNRYIDFWEAEDSGSDEFWSKLGKLTESMLALHSRQLPRSKA
jgi:hypothetical protein